MSFRSVLRPFTIPREQEKAVRTSVSPADRKRKWDEVYPETKKYAEAKEYAEAEAKEPEQEAKRKQRFNEYKRERPYHPDDEPSRRNLSDERPVDGVIQREPDRNVRPRIEGLSALHYSSAIVVDSLLAGERKRKPNTEPLLLLAAAEVRKHNKIPPLVFVHACIRHLHTLAQAPMAHVYPEEHFNYPQADILDAQRLEQLLAVFKRIAETLEKPEKRTLPEREVIVLCRFLQTATTDLSSNLKALVELLNDWRLDIASPVFAAGCLARLELMRGELEQAFGEVGTLKGILHFCAT